jgi:hypothetical protein
VDKIEPDHMVVERLSLLAADMPRQDVECLRLIVEGDTEGWRVHSWREHARTILATAIQGTDAGARQAAVDLVHRLGARGYFEFRDLLPKAP